MKKITSVLQVAALSLVFTSSLHAGTEAAPLSLGEGSEVRGLLTMECIAAHDDTTTTFYGVGLKFIGAHMAINECKKWAEGAGKDAGKCRIVSCEPVADDGPEL